MNKPVIGITVDIEDEYYKVKKYYSEAIASAGGIPLLIPPEGNTADHAEIINGLLISGGGDLDPSYYHEKILQKTTTVPKKRTDFEMSLLEEVIRLHKPVLGVCYGMQLINVFGGGTLYQDIGSQMPVANSHKKGYHMIVLTENRFLRKGRFSVNSTHHQAVKKLGKGLTAFARSADNLVEAFSREKYPFLVGVQWHPERQIEEKLSLCLFQSFIKAADAGK
jgi:putative glutamine amidotransferase